MEAGATLNGYSVLVVDDHRDTLSMIAEYLEIHGARVLVAFDAESARAQLENATVDLVITDIALPRENGYRFMSAVRGCARHLRVPAIAISGRVGVSDIERDEPGLFQATFEKPFDLHKLIATARSLLGD